MIHFLRSLGSNFYLFALFLLTVFSLSPEGVGISNLPFSKAGLLLAIMPYLWIFVVLVIVIPPLFSFLLATRLAHICLDKFGIGYKYAGILVGLGTLALIPFAINLRLDAVADSILAKNINEMGAPAPIDTLAVVASRRNQGTNLCGELCQRVLLNGTVRRIIMVEASESLRQLNDTLSGKMYSLEKRRSSCPEFKLLEKVGKLNIKSEKRKQGIKTAADLLRLKIAGGFCFIEEKTPILVADAVLFLTTVQDGKTDSSAGLDPFANTISSGRLSFFRRENGKLRERYRSSGITYYKLWPLLMLGSTSHNKLARFLMLGDDKFDGKKPAGGFLRYAKYKGGARNYRLVPAVEPFVQDVLGFNLTLSDGAADAELHRIIVASLNRPGSLDQAVMKLSSDFFEDIARSRKFTEENRDLTYRILSDKRMPLSRYTPHAIRESTKDDTGWAAKFAQALFRRLSGTGPEWGKDALINSRGYLAALGNSIAVLPDQAILPYKEQLIELAQNPIKRTWATSALMKLGIFGANAVPTLIYLIDDSLKYEGKIDKLLNAWKRPYLAGVNTLCLMGIAGKAAIPTLYNHIDSGIISKAFGHWSLMIHTLISLGADPAEMWTHLNSGSDINTHERFVKIVQVAKRSKNKCRF